MKYKDLIKGNFDPFKINAILFDSSVYYPMIPSEFGKRWKDKPLIRVCATLASLIKIGIDFFPKRGICGIDKYASLIDRKVVFFLPTNNNLLSLKCVIDDLEKADKNNIIIDEKKLIAYFPWVRIALKSLCYVPYFLREIKKLPYSKKRITLYYSNYFLATPGYVWFYFKLLSRCKPECVVLSNDHIADKKSLIYVCEVLRIKTLYVQHAPVSYAFPELHFTYNFLDGIDAYEKYTFGDKKTSGDTFLLGAVRYDRLSELRQYRDTNAKTQCIGIAINMLDDYNKIDDLCKYLLKEFPSCSLKIRSHPAMKDRPYVFCHSERFSYTCAKDEPITDYLRSIDMQIAGDSGVHLDALIAGVESHAYNFTCEKYIDNYGFVKNHVIELLETKEKVGLMIHGFYDKNERYQLNVGYIKRLDESYGKRYSGACHSIISSFILHNYDIKYLVDTYGFDIKSDKKGFYYFIPE